MVFASLLERLLPLGFYFLSSTRVQQGPTFLLLSHMPCTAQTLNKHGRMPKSHPGALTTANRETSFFIDLGYYRERKPTKQIRRERERGRKGRQIHEQQKQNGEVQNGEGRETEQPSAPTLGSRRHLCLSPDMAQPEITAREPRSLSNLRSNKSPPNWRHSGDSKGADLSLAEWKPV